MASSQGTIEGLNSTLSLFPVLAVAPKSGSDPGFYKGGSKLE